MVGKPDRALPLRSRLDTDPIVYSTANPLFAAEVALGRLDRDMAQKELDLFQFATCRVWCVQPCSERVYRSNCWWLKVPPAHSELSSEEPPHEPSV